MALAKYLRRPTVYLIAMVCVCAVVIGLVAFLGGTNVYSLFSGESSLYKTSDTALQQHFEAQAPRVIGWSELLPDEEYAVFQKYQSKKDIPLHEQVFTALQASFDERYQSMQHSMQTVPEMNNLSVQLSGFVVPVDTNDEREVLSFFLVPYFGACIHFPPPSPNQMVYVRTPGGLQIDDIENPVSVTGILKTSMFEDPMGSSAYLMDAVAVVPFVGQPDDVRQHDVQTY
ncbi:DUF3299 domain-containing protein [Alteromonas sp. C1M14]|uniref:DUF3299 domain-containing protein n=1 Tax=Alteromonas sp. C1M14 TaxID=2841567 RepID=UPI001C09EB24|nr:DUF3299 domain-containing protein [Alteromonas sp. C1M14]MBU2978139.1 DUF3299 domain-containing protein [Alteromonas sp. C1M14]